MTATTVLQSEAKESEVDTGIERNARLELAGLLSESLANTYLLYVKTQGVHWNVVGPLFYGLHKLTEEQYQDLAESVDEIAERIRAIGFPAPASFAQFLKLGSIEEETGTPKAEDMIAQLMDGNDICCKKLRKAALEAEKLEDIKTMDLLTERVGKHEENAWMLRSLLSQ